MDLGRALLVPSHVLGEGKGSPLPAAVLWGGWRWLWGLHLLSVFLFLADPASQWSCFWMWSTHRDVSVCRTKPKCWSAVLFKWTKHCQDVKSLSFFFLKSVGIRWQTFPGFWFASFIYFFFFFENHPDCCKDREGRTDCPGQWEFGWWGTSELVSKLSLWKQCFVFPAGWLLSLGWLVPLRGSDWLIWSMWLLFWGDKHHLVGAGTPWSLRSFPAHSTVLCDFA